MPDLQSVASLKSRTRQELREAEAKVQELQQRLNALERVEQLLKQPRPNGVIQPKHNEYTNMRQDDAIEDALRKAGRKLSAREIAEMLGKGGFPFTSRDPINPVYSLLKKNVDRKYTSEKVGTNVVFGLAAWDETEIEESTSTN